LAPHQGVYKLSFLDQEFTLEAGQGATFVSFVEVAPPPKPESTAERWRAILEKLARIEELVIKFVERDE
jgi:hypothetical protein